MKGPEEEFRYLLTAGDRGLKLITGHARTLRSAVSQDFDYCRRLYFAEMTWMIEAFRLD